MAIRALVEPCFEFEKYERDPDKTCFYRIGILKQAPHPLPLAVLPSHDRVPGRRC